MIPERPAGHEHVVLLDEAGEAIGSTLKSDIHNRSTPLHLAFSCYVVDAAGRVLLTRRGAGKLTWPGVWTNSYCGHPRPGELMTTAIRRRLRHELGMEVGQVDPILPRFRYRAVMENGIAENEMCPVFRVTTIGPVLTRLNPDEVDAAHWIRWRDLVAHATDPAARVSPWCRDQVAELEDLGDDPRRWATRAMADLPPAALCRVPGQRDDWARSAR